MKTFRHFLRHYSLHALALILLPSAAFLLVFLTRALANRQGTDDLFKWLIQANLLVGGLLLLTLLTLIILLIIRYKNGRFGAKITSKVATYFMLIGVLPGLLIFLVSIQFLSRSIESWFDVSVDQALKSGVDLGANYFKDTQNHVIRLSRAIEMDLIETGKLSDQHWLQAEQLQEVSVFDQTGQVILSTVDKSMPLTTRDLEKIQAGQLRVGHEDVRLEHISQSEKTASTQDTSSNNNPMMVDVLLPMKPNKNKYLALRVRQVIDPKMIELSDQLQATYQSFQLTFLGRTGLKKMYIGTLTLTLFLAMFLAILLAMLLSRELAKPLILLFQGTHDVVSGKLVPLTPLRRNDELGDLITSFNKMIGQLAYARAALERSNVYLESILANITAGVMVLDPQFKIVQINRGAEKVLGLNSHHLVGKSLAQMSVLKDFADVVQNQFEGLLAQGDVLEDHAHWQAQMELLHLVSTKDGEPLTLLIRGARLPLPDVNQWDNTKVAAHPNQLALGYVLVFDDINDLLSAQRSQAWSEVARRMAHEIKNPLTPIQLSAERLEHKLLSALPIDLQPTLKKSVQTIVNQVNAMKEIVDGFRDYAKVPPAQFEPIQLNDLVQDVLTLYGIDRPQGGVAVQANQKEVTFEISLTQSIPLVKGDSTQLRQIIHNLLANSVDALSAIDGIAKITVRTAQYEYQDMGQKTLQAVRLIIEDTGCGFPQKVLSRLFEPYMTTKATGTGLGLAVVKKIIEDHHALIDVKNIEVNGQVVGARVTITFRRIMTDKT